MSQVSTNAGTNPPPNRSTAATISTPAPSPSATATSLPGGTASGLPGTGWMILVLVAAAAAAMALATRAPLATTVIGLIVFGVLHNVLEIRYVAGRFGSVLTGRFLALLLTLITGIVVCRLAARMWPGPARTAEIVLGFVILGVGCWIGLRGGWLALAWGLLAVAATVAIAMPGYYFVILTHLHNLVPLIFLWEWAIRLPALGDRWLFRAVQVLWIVVLPLLILAGVFDSWIDADPGVAAQFVGDGSRMVAATAPPDVVAQLGLRFLVMFAFMQTMHYVVWVALPAPVRTRRDRRLRRPGALAPRPPGLAAGTGRRRLLAVLFCTDYFQGRALYGALASYHAYLEFPVLLALLLAGGRALVGPARALSRRRVDGPIALRLRRAQPPSNQAIVTR